MKEKKIVKKLIKRYQKIIKSIEKFPGMSCNERDHLLTVNGLECGICNALTWMFKLNLHDGLTPVLAEVIDKTISRNVYICAIPYKESEGDALIFLKYRLNFLKDVLKQIEDNE